jgi:hypothetical protein
VDCRNSDAGIVAHWHDGFKGPAAATLDGPFPGLLHGDGPGQAADRSFIGEDPDGLGAAPDLAVRALAAVCRVPFRATGGSNGHIGGPSRMITSTLVDLRFSCQARLQGMVRAGTWLGRNGDG